MKTSPLDSSSIKHYNNTKQIQWNVNQMDMYWYRKGGKDAISPLICISPKMAIEENRLRIVFQIR